MQNKRTKILRIITRLNIGGPATHVILLTKEFNNDKFESVLIYGSISKQEGDMSYLLKQHGVSGIHIPLLRREINPFADLIAFLRILLYMWQYKPDIVHTHTAKAGTLGRVAAILAGVPIKIHTFHGNVFRGYFDNSKSKFFILIEKFLAKFTDVIIAISTKQKDDIVNRHKVTSIEKCHIVKLGFELQRFLNTKNKSNIFRNKFKFNMDDILVGTVGRLTAIKNQKMFINAIAHINKIVDKKIFDKMKFIIVGDGELKEELVAYCRFNGLAEKVFFTGWLKELDAVYADLDIVTLTSNNEGTPVSLIEALSSSKPVISTDVGGVRDAVSQAGILVKRNDYKTLGSEISSLATSQETRQERGRQGRDFVRNKYSKERLVEELRELYTSLIKQKRRDT